MNEIKTKVPGRMASKLEAKLDFSVAKDGLTPYMWCSKGWDYFVVWFKLSNFKPFMIDCWFYSIALRYDKLKRHTVNAPGVYVKPQYFGLTEPLEFLWPSVRFMKNENEDFIPSMKHLVEKAVQSNHNKPVVLICHSLGCIYTHHFLTTCDKMWKKVHVRAMISIAAPYGGEFRMLYAFIGADDNIIAKTFPIVRIAERTFSSTAQLLPNPLAFREKVLISTPHFNYTASNYQHFFHTIKRFDVFDMWLDSKDTLDAFIHPEVDVYCIVGSGVKTLESLDVFEEATDKYLKNKAKKFLRLDSGTKYGDGDGIVNTISALRCLQWRNNLEYNFYFQEFALKHLDLLKHPSVVRHIMNILTNIQYT
ncbi:group XV phospholipase A2-like isoform X2 [Dinothrombium tinctorium]|uniref:Group XV phospholipase A2-like isoform X2 n=1 Tax=Dinothrombium tinctorium TaxID=1965070 RepID=A0A443QWD5_9ACAR|nr:group XV phospholipase A2-like isoform X2 [Dinothrombium tinctorium]